MAFELDPDELLAGPRGRRLCWELLRQTGGWSWQAPSESAGSAHLARALGDAVARSDTGAVAGAQQPTSLLLALADSVTWAMYWQPPDDWDRRLADPDVAEQLQPVAEALRAAPAARWWATPMDAASQHEVVFEERDGHPLPAEPVKDGRATLPQWRENTLEDERRSAERPDDPTAAYSGCWWSTPAMARLRTSTRGLDSLGPVGLHLVEDELGWQAARSVPLQIPPQPSIFEIRAPEDWSELVARHPLLVTKARRHDWWRTTGLDVAWAIPDYPSVAAEYDGIHLTVAGYLSTAGRAIPAGEAHTVLAGWNPDQTWWLTERPRRAGPASRWTRTGEPEPFAWTPAPALAADQDAWG